jgi:hypothetical protein
MFFAVVVSLGTIAEQVQFYYYGTLLVICLSMLFLFVASVKRGNPSFVLADMCWVFSPRAVL